MEDWTVLWDLFTTFLMVGSVSFGGGYAMVPVMEREVVGHGWMTLQQFTDTIAVAGMSPGPIAANTAIVIGYKTAGLPGSIVGAIAVALPSLIIMVAVASFYYRIHKNEFVKGGFYVLRPIVAGFIFYAAISFALGNGVIPTGLNALNRETWMLLGIFLASFLALARFKVHPLLVMTASGLAGTMLFM